MADCIENEPPLNTFGGAFGSAVYLRPPFTEFWTFNIFSLFALVYYNAISILLVFVVELVAASVVLEVSVVLVVSIVFVVGVGVVAAAVSN